MMCQLTNRTTDLLPDSGVSFNEQGNRTCYRTAVLFNEPEDRTGCRPMVCQLMNRTTELVAGQWCRLTNRTGLAAGQRYIT